MPGNPSMSKSDCYKAATASAALRGEWKEQGGMAGAGAQNGNASRMRAGASASQTATAAPDPESHFNIMHSIFT